MIIVNFNIKNYNWNVAERIAQLMKEFVMKKILALAILLAMLAVPVMAAPMGVPNENSGKSVAAYVDLDAIVNCFDGTGFSEIGVCISTLGGYHEGPGLSNAAHLLHKSA
jgi:hypothetical protein